MATNYYNVNVSIPIYKFVCPYNVNAVNLETIENQIYDLTSIPRYVEHIKFGSNFNQQMETNTLPIGLQSIIFGWKFNHPIGINVFPNELKSIVFGILTFTL